MRGFPRHVVPLLACATFLIAAPLSESSPQSSASGARAEQDQLFLGTWRLDLSKSRYSPGPPPKSETRLYARDAQGVRGQIDRLYADGSREIIDYRADADHDSPVSGTKAYDAVRFKRVDERTIEAVLSHAGRVWGTARRVVSEDGQTLTIAFRRLEPGNMVNNVAVYHKEKK